MNTQLPATALRGFILRFSVVALTLASFTSIASATMMSFSYTVTGSGFELSGPDRLFRDGVPSTAPTSKPFPGTVPNLCTLQSTHCQVRP
jgi:hypothetical protein